MAAKSANLNARIEPNVKVPATAAADISNMSTEALDAELEKGYADIKAGHTKPASQFFCRYPKGLQCMKCEIFPLGTFVLFGVDF